MNNGIYESRMEIQRLKERNAFLEEANAKLHFELSQFNLEVLKEKVERYEKALKFYANENSYVTDMGSFKIEATVMIDKGNRAKEALEG